jgi:hypothetical protein
MNGRALARTVAAVPLFALSPGTAVADPETLVQVKQTGYPAQSCQYPGGKEQKR